MNTECTQNDNSELQAKPVVSMQRCFFHISKIVLCHLRLEQILQTFPNMAGNIWSTCWLSVYPKKLDLVVEHLGDCGWPSPSTNQFKVWQPTAFCASVKFSTRCEPIQFCIASTRHMPRWKNRSSVEAEPLNLQVQKMWVRARNRFLPGKNDRRPMHVLVFSSPWGSFRNGSTNCLEKWKVLVTTFWTVNIQTIIIRYWKSTFCSTSHIQFSVNLGLLELFPQDDIIIQYNHVYTLSLSIHIVTILISQYITVYRVYRLCRVYIHHIISYHVMSYHVMSCHVMSCHVMSCHVMSYHIISYHVMLYHVISCYIIWAPTWAYWSYLTADPMSSHRLKRSGSSPVVGTDAATWQSVWHDISPGIPKAKMFGPPNLEKNKLLLILVEFQLS